MPMKILQVCLCLLLITACAAAQQETTSSKEVADSETAIKIAEAALIHTNGKQSVDSQQPFKAELIKDIWIVTGTLHCPTAHCFGAAATIKVAKTDGHIVSIYQPK